MQNILIEKFLANKHKTLLLYALTLYKVYDIKDEKLWNDEDEFKKIISDILDIYIKKYYLRDKLDLEKLNVNNLNKKDFKMTLALAVISDYYKTEYENTKAKYKKAIYNLTLIVYIVTNVDKDISFYNKTVNINSIVEKINELFGDVIGNNELEKNPFVLDILANNIKDSERKEIRFFESLKSVESYNTFIKYTDEAYFIDYQKNFINLLKFDNYDVKKIYEKHEYKEMFFPVSYELAAITILKLIANNCEVPIMLLPINEKYINLKDGLNKIKEIFSNPYIKKHIKFSIPYKDYKGNEVKFKILKDIGFDVAIFIDEYEVILDYSNIKYDYAMFITNKFLKNNPKFEEFNEKSKDKYQLVSDERIEMNEDELINVSLKEEN